MNMNITLYPTIGLGSFQGTSLVDGTLYIHKPISSNDRHHQPQQNHNLHQPQQQQQYSRYENQFSVDIEEEWLERQEKNQLIDAQNRLESKSILGEPAKNYNIGEPNPETSKDTQKRKNNINNLHQQRNNQQQHHGTIHEDEDLIDEYEDDDEQQDIEIDESVSRDGINEVEREEVAENLSLVSDMNESISDITAGNSNNGAFSFSNLMRLAASINNNSTMNPNGATLNIEESSISDIDVETTESLSSFNNSSIHSQRSSILTHHPLSSSSNISSSHRHDDDDDMDMSCISMNQSILSMNQSQHNLSTLNDQSAISMNQSATSMNQSAISMNQSSIINEDDYDSSSSLVIDNLITNEYYIQQQQQILLQIAASQNNNNQFNNKSNSSSLDNNLNDSTRDDNSMDISM